MKPLMTIDKKDHFGNGAEIFDMRYFSRMDIIFSG
jgi:hypothetical protein